METNYTQTSTYNYNLPPELIAQTPLEPRDSSRLLLFNKSTGEITHQHFYDIIKYLRKGDVLVINTSRVLPARIYGKKENTDANIEFLLHKRENLNDWEVICRPAKRLKIGTKVFFAHGLSATILEKFDEGICKVHFDFEVVFEEILMKIGTMPLPPYIHEKLTDQERYQTVYSKQNGSSAAPTAGLHFTPNLLQKIKDMGVEIVEVLLHVGLGTFRPVKDENILNHKMHSEYYLVTENAATKINLAKAQGRRVIACVTTSVRVLESVATQTRSGFEVKAGSGNTDIFIYPPYKFKIVDALITNFHLPESTLLMLISAFCGLENVKEIYKTAVEEKYRFFSFGDACFFF